MRRGAKKADVTGRAGSAGARRGAAPVALLDVGVLSIDPVGPEFSAGRDRRKGVSRAVAPSKSPRRGPSLEPGATKSASRRAPRKDHVPGLGHFGVKLRPDAREVAKCRSPPANLIPTWCRNSCRGPRRVLMMETSPVMQPRAVRAGLPNCGRGEVTPLKSPTARLRAARQVTWVASRRLARGRWGRELCGRPPEARPVLARVLAAQRGVSVRPTRSDANVRQAFVFVA